MTSPAHQPAGEEEKAQNVVPAAAASALHEEMRKEEVEGISMCQQFSQEHASCIESMGLMFLHAASHVEASLRGLASSDT